MWSSDDHGVSIYSFCGADMLWSTGTNIFVRRFSFCWMAAKFDGEMLKQSCAAVARANLSNPRGTACDYTLFSFFSMDFLCLSQWPPFLHYFRPVLGIPVIHGKE